MERLTQIIEENGPQIFTKDEISSQVNLFEERSALIYTSTENLPSAWIGSGPLDVTLPIVIPSYYEFIEIRAYRSPRLWLDLIQRTTGKIRWTAIFPAQLRIIRYDTIQQSYAEVGAKALVDALKVKTTGRSDRLLLYYFGAILDDSPSEIIQRRFEHEIVRSPSDAKTRIIVEPYCE